MFKHKEIIISINRLTLNTFNLILLILLIFRQQLFSANVDEEYINDRDSNFIVKPYAGLSFINFSFEKNDNSTISYTPKVNFNYGISLSWKILGLSAGLSTPVQDDRLDSGENEESFDFRLNYYGRYVGCDIYMQHRKGLYLDDADKDNTSQPYYEDMTLYYTKLSVYYIFSWKTFSMRAAFDGTDIQKKSASSILLMASWGMIEIENSSSLLLDETDSPGDKYYGLNYYSQKYVSLSPGYGWLFVFSNKYYFSFIAFLGAGLQNSRFRTASETFTGWSYVFEPDFRMAAGYSSDRIFYGLSILAPIHISSMDSDRDFVFMAFNVQFHAGYRF